jgi:hypothetical protein
MVREHSNYIPPPSVGHEIGVMFGFIGTYPILFLKKSKYSVLLPCLAHCDEGNCNVYSIVTLRADAQQPS